MIKLCDIYSYFDYSECYMFDMKQVWDWSGQILLNEDGWFEGIINYSHEKKLDKYVHDKLFIYGIFIPGQGIKIIESVPYRSGSILRELSIGTYLLNEDGYQGYRSIGTDKFQKGCCASKIDIKRVMTVTQNQNMENEYRDVPKEIIELKNVLKIIRIQNPYKELYLSIYKRRKIIIKELTTLKESGKKFGRLIKTSNHFDQSRKLV